ncbi:MAG: type IV pilus biogenesis/stability protein PilW [Rudaea sp.]|uniref:type IV pilus biogenesis/stability protein PilW n=1 Tax=unclassified Rudaea TaxID=2627037 RepID=UPI0010F4DDB0|nr:MULTISPECIES: type IV pilus biogenesis/stability protein PilW [unclassified Rudaea]MBN8888152.1 type IV pilus biogenesis/stability protein PilW [Rudaea sp.]MBR0344226.1 type IV pilus biogenesis/stability protein PilW [Rudaea sp.]
MRPERSRARLPLSALAVVVICVISACSRNSEGIRPISVEGQGSTLKSQDTPADKARPFVQLGQKYMELGKLELAQENLLKALKYDPKSIDAHTLLATLYDRVGESGQALQHYREAALLAPKAGAENNNYGMYLCKVGQYAESRKYFDVAFADGFYGGKAATYTNAGTCELLGKGSLDRAEADFRNALALEPSNGQALFQLANVLYLKNDFFKARAFVQRYDALGQPSPDALLLARNIEIKLGHADAARDYAQRLRDQFPDSEQARALQSTPSS